MPLNQINSHRRVNDKPLFNTLDYLAVRRAMDRLPLIEKLVIEMRFFHGFSIEEIARLLRIDWDETDALIDSTLLLLKRECCTDFGFGADRMSFLEAA